MLANAEFYNNKPAPHYSLTNMPRTSFSCRGKILGGYYADAETQCQMFHVCVKVAGVGVSLFYCVVCVCVPQWKMLVDHRGYLYYILFDILIEVFNNSLKGNHNENSLNKLL